ncbi:MAG: hypothetical protein E7564_00965 [Ruminococcaceae bacterium]|nr:hypothetical protein [Oscillospiraceae bacterium]
MEEDFSSYETNDSDLSYSSDSSSDYSDTDTSDYSADTGSDTDYSQDSGYEFSEDTGSEYNVETSSDSSFDAGDFNEDSENDMSMDYNETDYNSSDYNTDDYSENYTDFEEDAPKTLVRDERELLETGYNNVEQQLDVLADDYRDKGYSESEIESMLASDRYRLQQEFLNDAFPGQQVTPHVFNGFRQGGAREMMNDIENYEGVREILAPGTESSVGSGEFDDFEEDVTESYEDSYEESVDGDFETLDFEEDVEDSDSSEEMLDSTFENEEDFEEETFEEDAFEEDEIPFEEEVPAEEPEVSEGMPMGEVHDDGSIDTDMERDGVTELNDSTYSQSETNEPVDISDIDYDSIYEGIEADALAEGFKDVNLDTDSERLNSSLSNFEASNWENLSLDEQKESMQGLADYVSEISGIENPPKIEYYNNETEGDYGGYDPESNTLMVNEYMLYNSDEAADTIAHELWHCHQHERAMNPQSALDYQYQHNFDNYISPDLDQQAYEDQLVEAEARAFANQFKDRLQALKGR